MLTFIAIAAVTACIIALIGASILGHHLLTKGKKPRTGRVGLYLLGLGAFLTRNAIDAQSGLTWKEMFVERYNELP